MTCRVAFKSDWIFDMNSMNTNAVPDLIKGLKSLYGEEKVTVTESSLNDCSLEITAEINQNSLKSNIEQILTKIIPSSTVPKPYQISFENNEEVSASISTPPSSPEETSPAEHTQAVKEEAATPIETAEETLSKIDSLSSVTAFKNLCHRIHKRAGVILANKTESVFCSQVYLFAVDVGCGYSTMLALFEELLCREKLFSPEGPITEISMPSPFDTELEKAMKGFSNTISASLSKKKILSIDISNWIQHTLKADFKKLLLNLVRDNTNGSIIFFRAPSVSRERIDQICEDINDLLPAETVYIDKFSNEDSLNVINGELSAYGFSIDDSAIPLVYQRIAYEKADGYYYGIHTLKKVARLMIKNHEEFGTDDSRMITCDSLQNFISKKTDGEVSGYQQLEKLVGMDEIKLLVRSIVSQILASKQNSELGKPCMHMAFVGSPGTGKTTVARILGQILKEQGVLRLGKFFEYKGRDLCGRYVGETAIKTSKICKEAYGSVLFIDEAYSLYRGDETTNDYGREAIDTLIAEMENNKEDLLVIFAGYEDDIDIMMQANTGMPSRIPYRITFDNYSRQQLYQIFMNSVKELFKYSEQFEQYTQEYFNNLSSGIMNRKDFGNGRFSRNLFERTWGKAVLRTRCENIHDIVLEPEDLDHAIKELSQKPATEKQPIGFSGC